jgi:hypothetical protein
MAALVTVLTVVLPSAIASASASSAAGNAVGAHYSGMILAVGSSATVCPVQGLGEAVPQRQFVVGACVAAEDTGADASSDDVVFRGDSRAPDEIVRSGGFQPRAPGSGTSLADFAANNTASDYVSTSRLESVAEGFAGRGGYVYGISTDGLPTVDVNATLGSASPYPDEAEIAIPGGIPLENILWSRLVP